MKNLHRGLGWERRLRKALDQRNREASGNPWQPWPNHLPKHVASCVDRLVDFHEFRGRGVLDLHDMATIIAQAAYDAGRIQG